MFRLVPATREHVMWLMPRMREADVAEMRRANMTPEKGLWRSYKSSMWCQAALTDTDEVAAVFGCMGSPLGGVGYTWLLTSAALERSPLEAVRIGRRVVGSLLHAYPKLSGVVDAEYERAVRYVALIGFQLGEPIPYGPYRWPFREYTAERG